MDLSERRELSLQTALARSELVANTRRFVRIVRIGLGLWVALLLADAGMAWIVAPPGPFWAYAAIRLAVLPLFVYVLQRCEAEDLRGAEELRRLEGALMLAVAWGVSAMAAIGGGLTSPYIAGLTCVIVGRGAALAQSWREAVPVNVGVLLGHPILLGLAALFRPELAAQWRDPMAVGTMVVGLALVGSTTLLAVLGAHNHWALRREMFLSRNIGRYEPVEKLGQGGMGTVWRARAIGLKQEVALKLLSASQIGDEAAVQRFYREIEALSSLSHPHVVRILDYGVTEDGLSYYAMELLRGENLREHVERCGPLPVDLATALVLQIAQALGEAHANGIVHRDVKPENIMLIDAGAGLWHARLVDFGVARVADGQATRVGIVVGTPAYLSPEACLGHRVGPAADVYALGCVWFFAMTGRTPFAGETSELLRAHASQPPPRLADALTVEVPPRVEQALARTLAKRPDDRYADGSALASALSGRSSARPGAGTPVQAPTRSADTIDVDLGSWR